MYNDIIDTNEKDFIKVCFNIVAGLEVKNESQAIAKEAILAEVEYLQNNWNKLKKMIQDSIIIINECAKEPNSEFNTVMKGTFGRVLNMMQELEGKSE